MGIWKRAITIHTRSIANPGVFSSNITLRLICAFHPSSLAWIFSLRSLFLQTLCQVPLMHDMNHNDHAIFAYLHFDSILSHCGQFIFCRLPVFGFFRSSFSVSLSSASAPDCSSTGGEYAFLFFDAFLCTFARGWWSPSLIFLFFVGTGGSGSSCPSLFLSLPLLLQYSSSISTLDFQFPIRVRLCIYFRFRVRVIK